MNAVPDLFEPIIGYRMWRVMPNGLLVGLYQHEPWPPRQAMTARCAGGAPYAQDTKQRAHLDGNDNTWAPPPVWACSCGVYAVKVREALLAELAQHCASGGLPLLVGSVALWGRVIEHPLGYRAEYAYPMVATLIAPLHDSSYDIATDPYDIATDQIVVTPKYDAQELADRVRALYGITKEDTQDAVRALVDAVEHIRAERIRAERKRKAENRDQWSSIRYQNPYLAGPALGGPYGPYGPPAMLPPSSAPTPPPASAVERYRAAVMKLLAGKGNEDA